MRIIVKQSTFLEALQRGSISAMMNNAQNNTSNLSLIIKSVKITVDNNLKELIFESFNNLLYTKFSIPINEDIEVKEEGSILVLAKELIDWINKQNNAKICLALSKSEKPEIINTVDENNGENKGTITKIGIVKILSKDDSNTGNKWSLDCYDPCQMVLNNSVKPNILFGCSTQDFKHGIRSISFSAMPTHNQHVFDSILFETHKEELYIGACDTTRCAIYKLNNINNLDENLKTGKIRVLIPCHLLKIICEYLNNFDIKFYYSVDKNEIFIIQDKLEFKILIPNKEVFKKFPSFSMLIDIDFENFSELNRNLLNNRISTVSLVNNSSALFKFYPDKSNLIIKAVSESGKSPVEANMPAEKINKLVKIIWSIKHLHDSFKVIKDDKIKLYLPKTNNNILRMNSEIDKNFSYYIMSLNNSKYNVKED